MRNHLFIYFESSLFKDSARKIWGPNSLGYAAELLGFLHLLAMQGVHVGIILKH